jgi:hypothetical protein
MFIILLVSFFCIPQGYAIDTESPIFQSLDVYSNNALSPTYATTGDILTFTLTLQEPDTVLI